MRIKGNDILAQLTFLLTGLAIITTVTFLYTLSTMYFSYIIITFFLYLSLFVIIGKIAIFIPQKFNVINIEAFRIASVFIGIIFSLGYVLSKGAAIYVFQMFFVNTKQPLNFNLDLFWQSTSSAFSNPVVIFGQPSNNVTISRFFNYFGNALLFIGLMIPKGSVSCKYISYNGNKICAKQFVVIDLEGNSNCKNLVEKIVDCSNGFSYMQYEKIVSLFETDRTRLLENIASRGGQLYLVSVFSDDSLDQNFVSVNKISFRDSKGYRYNVHFPNQTRRIIPVGINLEAQICHLKLEDIPLSYKFYHKLKLM